MHVLVIGGTRFVGPHVVRQLSGLGHEVTVLHRGEHEVELPKEVRHIRSPHAAMPVTHFPADTLSFDPDVVLHMIPMGEEDARAAMEAFRGRAHRIVGISSGDVYRAYGVFTRIEEGPPEAVPIGEDAPLRSVLHPYRKSASSPEALEYRYEKILAERILMGTPDLPGTILRFPKVYGPGSPEGLSTFYAFRDHPRWSWTHGYVENVATAVVLAVTRDETAGRVYNVGEHPTPTVAERLNALPPSEPQPLSEAAFNFEQSLVFDTSRIRAQLGYSEIVPYQEGIRLTLDNQRRR
jgi:nucleoside-diphosphate-sugar epimerase